MCYLVKWKVYIKFKKKMGDKCIVLNKYNLLFGNIRWYNLGVFCNVFSL